jgi:hypothetical protein
MARERRATPVQRRPHVVLSAVPDEATPVLLEVSHQFATTDHR